ncbi:MULTISPECIES: hypothetical protein [Halorussus]|uniref:hypothetical protein n=1 Tax=Halorussus TaxID=1070314 RepID=UPI0020A0E3C4|nr:hypothetical protein [Halorussus vallis]USZ75662.1 hypothetical protein NGM07_19815 [Halorussus vallis]USZ75717.1 hypothetical protein NGM07_20095 [Halorussus vallis]USZ75735.1 hypothetical protein NGM07_00040 [Halorussus vallis]
MPTGYCTVEDVRRALREASLPGDVEQDRNIVLDAITSQTEWLEKTISRHWYIPGGISEDSDNLIPTGPNSRDDEHDIPTHGALVDGASERERFRYSRNSDALLEAGPRHDRQRWQDLRREPKQEIRLSTGNIYEEDIPAYTRIRLARKDVKAITELSVVNKKGGYDDWVASSDYTGGVGNQHRGKDYWVRINNGGVSELYLNVHSIDDDIPSLSNAVYAALDYGHEGIPRNVRRAVAFLAGSDLVEEAVVEIPQNATVYNIETKADEMRSKAEELLDVYHEGNLGINQ